MVRRSLDANDPLLEFRLNRHDSRCLGALVELFDLFRKAISQPLLPYRCSSALW